MFSSSCILSHHKARSPRPWNLELLRPGAFWCSSCPLFLHPIYPSVYSTALVPSFSLFRSPGALLEVHLYMAFLCLSFIESKTHAVAHLDSAGRHWSLKNKNKKHWPPTNCRGHCTIILYLSSPSRPVLNFDVNVQWNTITNHCKPLENDGFSPFNKYTFRWSYSDYTVRC
jgi:hypothetical protein